MLRIKHLNIVFAFYPAVGANAGNFRLHSLPLGSFDLSHSYKLKYDPFRDKVPGPILRTSFN